MLLTVKNSLKWVSLVSICLMSIVVRADYVIGLNAGFSGPKEQENRAFQYGIEAYLNNINSDGGVKGEKIILEVLDDGFQQATAANNVQRLITRKNAIAVLGGSTTTTILSMNKAAKENDTLFIAPMIGAPELYDNRRYVLNVRPSFRDEIRFLADKLAEERVAGSDVVLIGEIGSGELAIAGDALKSRFGSNSIVELSYPENTLSVSGVVSRLSKLGRNHVVLTGGFAATAQIIASSTNSMHFYTLSNMDVTLMKSLIPADTSLKSVSFLPELDSNEEIVESYKRDLKALNPAIRPSLKGLEGYLSAKILLAGIREVVKPFEFEGPDDLIKLPFSVVRKFAGWVQRGRKDEIRDQLADALHVMHTIDVGLARPVGYDSSNNAVKWSLELR